MSYPSEHTDKEYDDLHRAAKLFAEVITRYMYFDEDTGVGTDYCRFCMEPVAEHASDCVVPLAERFVKV